MNLSKLYLDFCDKTTYCKGEPHDDRVIFIFVQFEFQCL